MGKRQSLLSCLCHVLRAQHMLPSQGPPVNLEHWCSCPSHSAEPDCLRRGTPSVKPLGLACPPILSFPVLSCPALSCLLHYILSSPLHPTLPSSSHSASSSCTSHPSLAPALHLMSPWAPWLCCPVLGGLSLQVADIPAPSEGRHTAVAVALLPHTASPGTAVQKNHRKRALAYMTCWSREQ